MEDIGNQKQRCQNIIEVKGLQSKDDYLSLLEHELRREKSIVPSLEEIAEQCFMHDLNGRGTFNLVKEIRKRLFTERLSLDSYELADDVLLERLYGSASLLSSSDISSLIKSVSTSSQNQQPSHLEQKHSLALEVVSSR